MTWPTWIDALKERYLADEGSVFVLHGDVVEGRWAYAGGVVDCGGMLRVFLERSRDVVGHLRVDTAPVPARMRLDFPGIGDRSAFTRRVEARMTLDKISRRADATELPGALGLIWYGLQSQGIAQAWILHHGERLAPARKRHLQDNAYGAPPLPKWNDDADLRASNNVVIVLAEDVREVRKDLLDSAVLIEVPQSRAAAPPSAMDEVERALAARRAAPVAVSMSDAEAEVDAALAGELDDGVSLRRRRDPEDLGPAPLPHVDEPAPEPAVVSEDPVVEPVSAPEPESPPPAPASPAAEPTTSTDLALSERINRALGAAVLRHPKGDWPANLPGREALAEVLHDVLPSRVGVLTFEVVEDQVRTHGEGADWFEQWFAGDIAVDAAVGMALGGLEVPKDGFTHPPEFSATALRALTRRVEKLLDREGA